MNVSDCMTRDVKVIAPDQTLRDAARVMAERDLGMLPVGENDRLVGMLTDRDIVVRAVCEGKGPETKVREAMSEEVCYCFEDEDIEHVMRNMSKQQIRRLPVMNRQKRLVGIVSLGDLATENARREALGDALGGISKPGGRHSQTTNSQSAAH